MLADRVLDKTTHVNSGDMYFFFSSSVRNVSVLDKQRRSHRVKVWFNMHNPGSCVLYLKRMGCKLLLRKYIYSFQKKYLLQSIK